MSFHNACEFNKADKISIWVKHRQTVMALLKQGKIL